MLLCYHAAISPENTSGYYIAPQRQNLKSNFAFLKYKSQGFSNGIAIDCPKQLISWRIPKVWSYPLTDRDRTNPNINVVGA